jgi:hypothetical protein
MFRHDEPLIDVGKSHDDEFIWYVANNESFKKK